MNASLAPDLRADMVVKQLTLDEKIQLVHGIGWGPLVPGSPIPPDNNGGAGEILGIHRLGIPALQQADSAVGVRMAAPQSRYATLLPSVLAAASSWDAEAAHLYGDVMDANSVPKATTSRLAAAPILPVTRETAVYSSTPAKIHCLPV